MRRRCLLGNKDGTTAVEFAIIFWLMIMFTFGIIDFSLVFFQWLAAERATHFGTRLAVVSTPVALDLNKWTGKTSTNRYGGPMPAFDPIVCDGATAQCSCSGICPPVDLTFVPARHARIVGRMNRAFGGGTRILPQNVVVEYRDIGLGFVGRPGGPVPAVTVSLHGMTYSLIVLDALMQAVLWGFGGSTIGPMGMPTFEATLTGEDLSTTLIDPFL